MNLNAQTQDSDDASNGCSLKANRESLMKAVNRGMKHEMRTYWFDIFSEFCVMDDSPSGYFSDPSVRVALGISSAQCAKIGDIIEGCAVPHDSSELTEIEELRLEINKLLQPFEGSYLAADDETKFKFRELSAKFSALLHNAIFRATENVLTPEQRQKLYEILTASLGRLPIISPRAFEALDLTDVQRQRVEQITRELQPEFEKYVEDIVDNELTLQMAVHKIVESEFDNSDSIHPDRMKAFLERLMKENQEIRRIQDEIQSQIRAFATLFKTRVFDVLTDKQRKHMQELIDNPPEHARIFFHHMRTEWLSTMLYEDECGRKAE